MNQKRAAEYASGMRTSQPARNVQKYAGIFAYEIASRSVRPVPSENGVRFAFSLDGLPAMAQCSPGVLSSTGRCRRGRSGSGWGGAVVEIMLLIDLRVPFLPLHVYRGFLLRGYMRTEGTQRGHIRGYKCFGVADPPRETASSWTAS
jgi:hypothetical protein